MTPRRPEVVPCTEVVELITDYLDGALPAEQAEEIRGHLKICPGCQAYLEQFRATIDALGTLPVDTLSEGVYAELVEAFRRASRDH